MFRLECPAFSSSHPPTARGRGPGCCCRNARVSTLPRVSAAGVAWRSARRLRSSAVSISRASSRTRSNSRIRRSRGRRWQAAARSSSRRTRACARLKPGHRGCDSQVRDRRHRVATIRATQAADLERPGAGRGDRSRLRRRAAREHRSPSTSSSPRRLRRPPAVSRRLRRPRRHEPRRAAAARACG